MCARREVVDCVTGVGRDEFAGTECREGIRAVCEPRDDSALKSGIELNLDRLIGDHGDSVRRTGRMPAMNGQDAIGGRAAQQTENRAAVGHRADLCICCRPEQTIKNARLVSASFVL